MALTLGGGTGDLVSIAAATSINTLAARTYAFWVRPTTATVNHPFFDKLGIAGTGIIATTGFPADLQLVVNQSGGLLNYVSNNTPLTSAAWQFVVFTYDSAATPRGHIYRGSLTASPVECTYGTSADGSGTPVSDSTNPLRIGNSGALNVAFQGDMAWFGMWNRALSLGEIKALQFRLRPTSGCVVFQHFGFNGTGTQPDWSGNANSGTVSGATAAAHVPLPSPFGFSPFGGNIQARLASLGFDEGEMMPPAMQDSGIVTVMAG